MQGKWPMTEAAPITSNRTLRRLPNAAYRQREYLTEAEVERLIEAARKRGRNGPRDGAAILLAYRHGLRAAELCQLRWAQIDLRQGRLPARQSREGRLLAALCRDDAVRAGISVRDLEVAAGGDLIRNMSEALDAAALRETEQSSTTNSPWPRREQ
jgi:integrase